MLKQFCFKLFLPVVFLLYSGIIKGQKADSTQSPFNVSVAYTADVFSNVSGGLDTGTRYMDNMDVNLEVNLGALSHKLRETTFYVYGLGNQGGSISSLAGDIQGVSNIEAINSWRIYEFWAQKKFLLARSSILLGLYDINSEFDVLDSSMLFINGSHGISPTLALSGVLGPSTFPYTSLAARIKVNPWKGLVFQFAALDGIPSNPDNPRGTKIFFRGKDGLLLLAELSLNPMHDEKLQFRNRKARLRYMLRRGHAGEDRYKFAVGGWMYTKKREAWSPSVSPTRGMGLYGLGEFKLYSETNSFDQGLHVFARAGIANKMANRLSGYLGAGAVYTGLLNGREKDETGIAIAHAVNSSAYIEQQGLVSAWPKAETNIEFTYSGVLSEWFQLQGNLQYVINPGRSLNIDDALVIGSRFIFSF